jgi:hypothetical protein
LVVGKWLLESIYTVVASFVGRFRLYLQTSSFGEPEKVKGMYERHIGKELDLHAVFIGGDDVPGDS